MELLITSKYFSRLYSKPRNPFHKLLRDGDQGHKLVRAGRMPLNMCLRLSGLALMVERESNYFWVLFLLSR